MTFLWHDFLWLLLLLPALVALYVLLLTKRKRTTLRLSSLAVVHEALGKRAAWRRHLPPVLLLAALAVLLLAIARPSAVMRLPGQEQTIILAMDVSGSMRATDVQPSRLVAAQEAARSFVRQLPRSVRVGIVEFAGTAAIAQAPTHNHDEVLAAIDRFQLQRGTATGSGIVISLAAMFPDAGIQLSQITGGRNMPNAAPERNPKAPNDFTPVAPGSYASGAIILLTDGQRTTGPDPMDAARMAADRGVKVYSVGIGTKDGETISFEGWSLRVRLDEDSLKNIARLTLGEYFYAGTADDLIKVYQSLSTRMVVERRATEMTGLLAAGAALLVAVAAGLSLLWFGRSG